jgi:hypothetical protein
VALPFVAGVAEAAAVLLVELLGLNKLPTLNLPGEAEAVGLAAELEDAVELLWLRFSAAEPAGDAVLLAAGEALAVGSVFFFAVCFPGDADAAGDSAGDADSLAVVFLCERCFSPAGEADGDSAGEGDWAKAEVAARQRARKKPTGLWCMAEINQKAQGLKS